MYVLKRSYKMIYQFTENNQIIRFNDDNSSTIISSDEANTDYQAYLAWLAEGNTPNPYVPPPEPAPLTPQEKLAAAGLSVADLKSLLGIN